jgi:ADP-ribose pyrophosphatase YjhB (NUDIX family)
MAHPEYDEDFLFKRKDNFLGFVYCPRCSQLLQRRLIDGQTRLQCPNEKCDYIYYHNPIPAAGALVVKDNSILLVKRAVPPKKGWWCLPAGFMEWFEHPEQTAVREVREETGLNIKLGPLFEIYTGRDDPRMNAVLILYLAVENGGRLEAADDALEVDYFDFENLPEKIAFESHVRALADYKERFLK